MNFQSINLGQLAAQLRSIAEALISLALLFILCGSTVKFAGYAVRYLPAMDPTPLAYLMGAWYLWRKAS